MKQPTVLVVSDEADFSRTVVNRWQLERSVPAFTVMSSALCGGASAAAYDVAVVGCVANERLSAVFAVLSACSSPIVFVAKDGASAKAVHEAHPRALILRQYEGWAEALVLLAGESLRKVEALNRAERSEQKYALQERDATLGRYMSEMRHSLNNALTSVLGNAELLLLEPGSMSTDMREQVDTIHRMALRIHEIVQRFSSLETEMSFVEKDSQLETKTKSQAFASGT
jgi:signal transduction histidine kinase